MATRNTAVYRRSVLVWVALIVLLLLTFGSSYLKLGAWNSAINLVIAFAKALLVAAFFMHLRGGPVLLRLVAAIALLTLTLLFGLSATDYATRVIHQAPWETPPSSISSGRK